MAGRALDQGPSPRGRPSAQSLVRAPELAADARAHIPRRKFLGLAASPLERARSLPPLPGHSESRTHVCVIEVASGSRRTDQRSVEAKRLRDGTWCAKRLGW